MLIHKDESRDFGNRNGQRKWGERQQRFLKNCSIYNNVRRSLETETAYMKHPLQIVNMQKEQHCLNMYEKLKAKTKIAPNI